jgi:hypothetical protein
VLPLLEKAVEQAEAARHQKRPTRSAQERE